MTIRVRRKGRNSRERVQKVQGFAKSNNAVARPQRLMSGLGRISLHFVADGIGIASGVAGSFAGLFAIPDQVV